MVFAMDKALRRLAFYLKHARMWKDTIFIFSTGKLFFILFFYRILKNALNDNRTGMGVAKGGQRGHSPTKSSMLLQHLIIDLPHVYIEIVYHPCLIASLPSVVTSQRN